MRPFTWWNRVLFGLLAAGVLAPLMTLAPASLKPPLLVAVTAVACVATALAIGRHDSSR